MENYNYIQDELRREAPFLAKLDNKLLYSVPARYFENFSTEIINKINEGQEPAYSFSNSMPFSVPEGFFDNFSKNVLQKISAGTAAVNEVFEEMETISPLLNTINKKPAFSLPEGYFDKAVTGIPVEEKSKAKIVSLASRQNKFMRYAVAAVIATILAIGMFLIIGKDSTSSLAGAESSSQVKSLSDEEIVNFLKTNAPNEDISSALPNAGKEPNIKKSVSQMSDEEIKAFLQETGDSDDI